MLHVSMASHDGSSPRTLVIISVDGEPSIEGSAPASTTDVLAQILRRALDQVEAARANGVERAAEVPRDHAADRWARAIVPVVHAPADPRTLEGWSRCAAASVGALKGRCSALGLSARRSLVFARLLRVVVQQARSGRDPAGLLDVVDKRTLIGLLKAGGVPSGDPLDLPRDVDGFISRQTLIDHQAALAAVRSALGGGLRPLETSLAGALRAAPPASSACSG